MRSVWYACVALGVLLLIVGFQAYEYEETSGFWEFPVTRTRPYTDIGLLTMGFGFVLIVVGAVLIAMKKPQAEKKVVYVPLKKCPKCGRQFSGREYEYCPTCGTKLEPT